MYLKFHLVNDLDLHFINDFYIFSKFCLTHSLLWIFTILDDLKVMF